MTAPAAPPAHDFEGDEGHHVRPQQGHRDAVDLHDHLLRIAFEQAPNSVRHFRADRERANGKHAGGERAGKSTDPVHAETYLSRFALARM